MYVNCEESNDCSISDGNVENKTSSCSIPTPITVRKTGVLQKIALQISAVIYYKEGIGGKTQMAMEISSNVGAAPNKSLSTYILKLCARFPMQIIARMDAKLL